MSVFRALVLFMTLVVGGTAASTDQTSKVTIRVQPLVGICAGKCPDFEVSVIGELMTVRRFDFRPTPRTTRTDHLSRADLLAFRGILAPLRSIVSRRPGNPCPLAKRDEQLRYGSYNYDIRWTEKGTSAQLLACFDKETALAVTKALVEIGVDMVGEHLDARGKVAMRECLKDGIGFC